jgi:hypothetical protein
MGARMTAWVGAAARFSRTAATLAHAERSHLLDRRVAIGRRTRGVGLGLLQLAPRDRVVLEQLLVQIGDALRIAIRRLRLAVRRRCGGKVRRGHRRERVTAPHHAPGVHEDPRDRPRHRREHLGGLVTIERHRARGLHRGAEGLEGDGRDPDPARLRRSE